MKRILLSIFVIMTPCGLLRGQSIWAVDRLSETRQSLDMPYYAGAYRALLAEADRLLESEPCSVMQKQRTAASGDKHDYLSQARYTWPDLSKPDGLPYISRDGETNPEINTLDRIPLGRMADRVTTLALAWYFSGDERYALKAVEALRVWFLDPKSRMNPNLNYAQIVRGRYDDRGRASGLIDSYSFVEMLDAVQLLEGSKSYPAKERKALRKWFSEFTRWMTTHENGIAEANARNNHSVAYDAQIVAYALYTGDTKLAREVLEALPERRIYAQIEPDGSQPHELRRTLAYHYSQYNLTHFIDLALMGKRLGLRVDRSVSDDGRSFYKAMDFLLGYTGCPQSEWPYEQISDWDGAQQNFCRDLYRTAHYLDDPEGAYLRGFYACRVARPRDRFRLIYGVPNVPDDAYAFADAQLRFAVDCAAKAKKEPENAVKNRVTPRTVREDGSLAMVAPRDWCSGFFAGSLWQLYAYTRDDYWREQAISWTWPVEEAKNHRGTHDLGFMIGDSFGKAWEQTGERSYRDVVVRAAQSLATRFDKQVGCIRSWDHNRDKWRFPVIIDNMMNLEMLFKATQLTGDSTYWHIAVSHADVTLRNHFRDDASSFHVVDYDPATGAVRGKCTHQGYADDSFWSRGQGWGLYGYTMCYRFTHDARYLDQACRIADFVLSLPNMPADGIFYWDMKLPEETDATPRDVSAAALIASGLYELCTYVEAEQAARYRAAADKIVESLHRSYQAPLKSHYGFLLLHSVGHLPGGSEIDVPLNYADYYYLEALARKSALDCRSTAL
ncbi:MAG: alginate lyase family protein [Alistipes sp.]|nr:alginate lyase family protein [Alistipes senegalensis]MCM1250518.1 alginate lyase family protein [Alistipes sp.]